MTRCGEGERMNVLIAGASGATGRLLVSQMLDRGAHVRAVVRFPDRLPAEIRNHPRLTVIHAAILDLGEKQLEEAARGCEATASCLGHNISLRGIWGPPRKLVADAVGRMCAAVRANRPEKPVRFVLMNTTACMNPDLRETRTLRERAVFALLRKALPPQADNEAAVEALRSGARLGDPFIEWVAVRPDGLTDEAAVSGTVVVPSPVRSPVTNPGKTSRINAARFMADLITDDALWNAWRGRMPVIYNASCL
jgi:nucleoside-diphosphate-sugar epimerase